MSAGEWAALAAALGVGGAVGAALAVLAAGARLAMSWEVLRQEADAYFAGRTDPQAMRLRAEFEAFAEQVRLTDQAVRRLRRSLRLK